MKKARSLLGERLRARVFSLQARAPSGEEMDNVLAEDERPSHPRGGAREDLAWLREHLHLLTARQRQVLFLWVEHGPKAAAEIAGITEVCVCLYVRVAISKLRRARDGQRVQRYPDRWKEDGRA